MHLVTRLLAAVAASVALALAFVRPARAHCDTMDGPTVADGRRALDSGEANHALKWVDEAHEAEVREAFELARRVRVLGDDARELADRYFLDTLVRLHRAGEGEPFTGIRPSGEPIDAKVVAADRCIAEGDLAALEALVPGEQLPELRNRFDRVLATKDFDVDDLAAARAYIAAYVAFFHLAEGDEHGHAHGSASGDEHGTHHAHR
ncbi:hypothetical protein BCL57_003215 [Agromyces flavus]|uniref:LysM domain-containing protein n=1 Tax=Agromyces flavus TaxID=589382 RepID=A0A1H1SJI5_9MICO|nr:DUF6448 family protein [Agromyces flavus]MCP2369036.1 hypothetical protein [Agromyces flavus]GGI48491.1 hypothetical protein GCM10010932_31790 [Agromyces flavus]SDS48122.1 hypothetical protein SAMN04489721_1394 [Agromyces flavus]